VATLTIPYHKLPFKPNEAFPEETSVWKPFVEVRINYKTAHIDCLALLDSGADNCLFPTEKGRAGSFKQILLAK